MKVLLKYMLMSTQLCKISAPRIELDLLIDTFMGKNLLELVLWRTFCILPFHCFDVCYITLQEFSHSDYFVFEKSLLEEYYTI